jgi:hypothetical protein
MCCRMIWVPPTPFPVRNGSPLFVILLPICVVYMYSSPRIGIILYYGRTLNIQATECLLLRRNWVPPTARTRTAILCNSWGGHKVLTYVEYTAVSGVFRTIRPPTRSPPSECVLAGRWGCGGLIFQDFGARHWIGLLEYNPSTRWDFRCIGPSSFDCVYNFFLASSHKY